MQKNNDNAWVEYLQNPKAIALKKFMIEILQSKFYTYEDLISRLGASLVTENDLSKFGLMINEIFEMGYTKAVNDYKDQLAKLGIEVNMSLKQKSLDDNR